MHVDTAQIHHYTTTY